VEVSRRFWRR